MVMKIPQHFHDVSDELTFSIPHSLNLSSTSGSENSKARIQCLMLADGTIVKSIQMVTSAIIC